MYVVCAVWFVAYKMSRQSIIGLRILTNEQYTGTCIAGNRESSRVGSKVWFIYQNNHPAIVSQEELTGL